ncbi:MAG: hypothetical protein QNJ85_12345 [Gammaproteobacteria bacterium]|nr:hypothetical protein [Gammaproteobacteria bacterium]
MNRLTIRRAASYRIITRALEFEGRALVGLLQTDADDCETGLDPDQLRARLDANPDAIIVYNQQADAMSLVDSLDAKPDRVYIEIEQDTKGVLGLYAHRRVAGERETVELVYQ